jgi:hypothetical protein
VEAGEEAEVFLADSELLAAAGEVLPEDPRESFIAHAAHQHASSRLK